MTYEEATKIVKDYWDLLRFLNRKAENLFKWMSEYCPGYTNMEDYIVDDIEKGELPIKVNLSHTYSSDWIDYRAIPLSYFFRTKDDIHQEILVKIEEEHQRKLAELRKKEEEKEARQRALYEKLKEKFEGGK